MTKIIHVFEVNHYKQEAQKLEENCGVYGIPSITPNSHPQIKQDMAEDELYLMEVAWLRDERFINPRLLVRGYNYDGKDNDFSELKGEE